MLLSQRALITVSSHTDDIAELMLEVAPAYLSDTGLGDHRCSR
ncbi:hypothetical protein ACLF6K_13450 [Streptomyces xanthophaeus]